MRIQYVKREEREDEKVGSGEEESGRRDG